MIKNKSNILLETRNITKIYPGVVALKNANFKLQSGKVHAFVGKNGAGKTTMIKIINGSIMPNSGEIFLKNQKAHIRNQKDAISLGIVTINQEFMIFPNLSVAENILLGLLPVNKFKCVNWVAAYKKAEKFLRLLGVNINPSIKAGNLSVAEQQIIEITRAISREADIFIMDEPTSTLTITEVDKLLDLIRNLRSNNKTIIYVSHKLDEVFKIADWITIFRDGVIVSNLETKKTSISEVINMMTGKKINKFTKEKTYERGNVLLSVKNLERRDSFQNITFNLHSHEVLGLAGLVGAGKTEITRAIFGIDPFDTGEVIIDGKKIKKHTPENMIIKHIGFVPEDRKQQGLILGMTVADNIMLAAQRFVIKSGFRQLSKEKEITKNLIKELEIKTPSLGTETLNLSGGNQQKVVIAKWLATKPRIIIFDEPTRGIDVGAKLEIYNIIKELAEEGAGIIFISSELEEILLMSDRIIVIHKGKIITELLKEEATQEKIIELISG